MISQPGRGTRRQPIKKTTNVGLKASDVRRCMELNPDPNVVMDYVASLREEYPEFVDMDEYEALTLFYKEKAFKETKKTLITAVLGAKGLATAVSMKIPEVEEKVLPYINKIAENNYEGTVAKYIMGAVSFDMSIEGDDIPDDEVIVSSAVKQPNEISGLLGVFFDTPELNNEIQELVVNKPTWTNIWAVVVRGVNVVIDGHLESEAPPVEGTTVDDLKR